MEHPEINESLARHVIRDRVLRDSLELEFAVVINKHSLENESGTPDYILAKYLVDCLEAYNWAHRRKIEQK